MENRGILYVFPVFHSAWLAKKIRCPAADDLFRVSLTQAARQGLSARIRFANANMILNLACCFSSPRYRVFRKRSCFLTTPNTCSTFARTEDFARSAFFAAYCPLLLSFFWRYLALFSVRYCLNFKVSNEGSEVAIGYDIVVKLDKPLQNGVWLLLDGKFGEPSATDETENIFPNAGTFEAGEKQTQSYTLGFTAMFDDIIGVGTYNYKIQISIDSYQIDERRGAG